ncbi:TMEM175 family protein [Streptomyces phaeochromogenes]|uniref:TMEM175 family protein n=1 Tax=Streptomyces phaeochromogenes TaxID=1923 RepID=UPI0033C6A83D
MSDGIYAIAMTLLVINVAIPAHLDDAAFHKALRDALPNLGAFALSFTLIAGFRRDHRRILTALPTETAVARRRFTAQLGSSVLIFGLSIPLAFVNTEAAMWFWLALIPAHYFLGHHSHRVPPWSGPTP